MATSQPQKLTTGDTLLNRIQDVINNVLGPLARVVGNTPIMGAPPPARIEPQLLNGWTQAAGTNARCSYHKDALGYVHIHGFVVNGTGGGLALNIFTLPVGYRPAADHAFAVRGPGSALAFLDVNRVGTVLPEIAVGAGGTLALDCIYLAEA